MRKDDGRQLSHATLEEIRIRAVKRVEAGESPEDVIRALGFSRARIYEWLAAWREGGIEALRARPVPGRPMKLSSEAIRFVYQAVTTKNPMQMKFEFALWTRDMVRELIREHFKVRLSEVSVGRLLRKLGLSPQRPLARAYQRDPELVESWMRDEYPAIVGQAKRHGAQIFFVDESTVRSDYHSGTTWAPVGQTPVVEVTGARFKVNLISAISPRGQLRFMCFEGSFKIPVYVDFVKRLMLTADGPVFLIADGHPVHRCKAIRQLAAESNGRLCLFFLPAYSPDLNPDELVWGYLKHHKIGKLAIKGPGHLKQRVRAVLRSLQKIPALVRSMFQHPSVRYAA
jgi:transposase